MATLRRSFVDRRWPGSRKQAADPQAFARPDRQKPKTRKRCHQATLLLARTTRLDPSQSSVVGSKIETLCPKGPLVEPCPKGNTSMKEIRTAPSSGTFYTNTHNLPSKSKALGAISWASRTALLASKRVLTRQEIQVEFRWWVRFEILPSPARYARCRPAQDPDLVFVQMKQSKKFFYGGTVAGNPIYVDFNGDLGPMSHDP